MEPKSPENYTRNSDVAMRWLLLGTAYFLVIIFIVGVFDIVLGLYNMFQTGEFTDPVAIIELIETFLLLLIIVEVQKTINAYVEEQPIARIIIGVGIVAVTRTIIAFRPSEFDSTSDALQVSVTLTILLFILVVGYYILGKVDIGE